LTGGLEIRGFIGGIDRGFTLVCSVQAGYGAHLVSCPMDSLIFKKSRIHLKMVCARGVTVSQFDTENSKILGAKVPKLVA